MNSNTLQLTLSQDRLRHTVPHNDVPVPRTTRNPDRTRSTPASVSLSAALRINARESLTCNPSGMFVLPYSPRWLAKQGRTEEARQTLIRLHGGHGQAKMEAVEAEIESMVAQIDWGAFIPLFARRPPF